MLDFIDLLGAEFTSSFAHLDWRLALARLALACLFGAIIGFEREIKHKSAGMRTNMLVSLAACTFALVTRDVVAIQDPAAAEVRVDPLRLVEAITSGVAFLGAGTIIITRARVRGLTTAAGMWLSGAVGLAVGVGNSGLGAMATLIAVMVLGPLARLEGRDPES
ncbi:MgtC/SapB family protein [Tropicimonas sp. IMCC6043]|uniref:MgtC/SapB family protein n=1 Tax=Tropicimonas sp. IMCC6043 TaxID=2510645 RepID=UPI00101CA7CB|nr:MgtC/SapB family protein [Tropicimonas sp. IMCC6043]RYH09113.1 MgtC/SapB family protein [Tropicimonas sp. IMCC6043]